MFFGSPLDTEAGTNGRSQGLRRARVAETVQSECRSSKMSDPRSFCPEKVQCLIINLSIHLRSGCPPL
jgi:exosome complex RNA-binding protein Rrp42 (RNase PH superfamily)